MYKNNGNSPRYLIMKDNQLQAVHDDDLSSLLISLGVYDEVSNGRCVCRFCQRVITLENLGAIIPLNGEIVFSCDSPTCMKYMSEVGCNNDDK